MVNYLPTVQYRPCVTGSQIDFCCDKSDNNIIVLQYLIQIMLLYPRSIPFPLLLFRGTVLTKQAQSQPTNKRVSPPHQRSREGRRNIVDVYGPLDEIIGKCKSSSSKFCGLQCKPEKKTGVIYSAGRNEYISIQIQQGIHSTL